MIRFWENPGQNIRLLSCSLLPWEHLIALKGLRIAGLLPQWHCYRSLNLNRILLLGRVLVVLKVSSWDVGVGWRNRLVFLEIELERGEETKGVARSPRSQHLLKLDWLNQFIISDAWLSLHLHNVEVLSEVEILLFLGQFLIAWILIDVTVESERTILPEV